MTRIFRKLGSFLSLNAQDIVATAALLALSAGCAMERASLGLIVPGSIVFGSMAVQKFRRT